MIPHSLVKKAISGDKDLLIKTDDHFVMINIELNVKEAGVFSAILASDFSDMFAYMSLRKKGTSEIIAVDKQYMLDEVINSSDHEADTLSTVETSHEENDHLTSIEITNLPEGEYELRIRIPKAFWTNPKTADTCLDFTFMMEYIPKLL